MSDRPATRANAEADQLITAWRAEETGPASGWDFSVLAGRMVEPASPWDFEATVREQLASAVSVLDMGTGGGEFLARFLDVLPADTIATEGWEPNIPVARAALSGHDIEVVAFGQPDDDPEPAPMPFPDGRFDIVLNRHEAYHPDEVARILTPGGRFLTQQVGGDEFAEVRTAFDHPPVAPHVRYDAFRQALVDAGLTVVDGAESVGDYEFTDVAALVAYLQLVPWEAPEDFSVDRYVNALLRLHQQGPAQRRPLLATRKRFWMLAEKP